MLNWQTVHIPLASGLTTGDDPRALNPPALAVCRDAQFDEAGGLQTRKPYLSMGSNIVDDTPSGGGSLADVRRIVANGDELLCFTKDALYAWSDRDSAWSLKATYLAASLTERTVFARTSEQTLCDRCEHSGVTFYAWLDTGAAAGVYIAALDTETGAVLLSPTAMAAGTTRPRMVTMTDDVFLFYTDAAADNLYLHVLDPAALYQTATNSPTLLSSVCNDYYDVVSGSGVAYVAYRRTVTTSYDVKRITDALGGGTDTNARTCDGPIAIALSPTGTHLQIVRANSTNIQGDLLLASDLSDVHTAQAIGTASGSPVFQIAAAFRSVQDSGAYRCYAFWHGEQDVGPTTGFATKSNWVNTSNTLGSQTTFVRRLAVASRAFDHNGEVYVWLAFASESGFTGAGVAGLRAQLQNTYFLYRDDGLLVAKAAADRAGGFPTVTGHLPAVQNTATNVYAWAGLERRVVTIGGNQTGYSARVPLSISVEFDSDSARRTARLGKTLYVAGGEVLQYDGTGLYEVGFHIYPWYFGATEANSTGSVEDGTYSLKVTTRWDNAVGERDRSTTATSGEVTVVGTGDTIQIVTWVGLHVTHKTSSASTPCQEVWRTLKDPVVDAPFYLATSNDPSDTSGPNCFVPNDHTATSLTAWQDDLPDATMAIRETNPENGGILENLAPPAASIIVSTQDRLFLAGIANAPHQIWYSKLRGDSEVAAFHDALTIDLPPDGGDITALAFMDETLVVFKETAIYALPGDGFDNAGGGQNYGPARRISADVGAISHETVALSPAGLVFKSSKGWALLGRGWAVDIGFGSPLSDFDADEIVAVDVLETQSQIRCMGRSSRCLTFDYRVGQWSEWTVADAVHATVWRGVHVYATATAVKDEQPAYSSLVTYGMDVETPWIKVADLQGYGAVDQIMVLGEYRSTHRLRVRVAYNYAESDASGPTWVDDKYFTATPTTVGGPLQFRHGPARRKCQAIKVRLTATHISTSASPADDALKLTGLALKVGFDRGLYRGLPAAQKQ